MRATQLLSAVQKKDIPSREDCQFIYTHIAKDTIKKERKNFRVLTKYEEYDILI